ncbi:MAG: aryl-sulfate sulfotransferase, partial [Muriicola sp.]
MSFQKSLRPLSFYIILCLFLTGCNSGFDYSIETTLNPHKIAPLTASLHIEAEKPVKATVNVLGSIPLEQEFDARSTNLEVPVVGLYPNAINKVVVTLEYEGGMVKDTLEIITATLPSHFPNIVIDTIDRNNMDKGMHACDIHFANKGSFNSGPFIFDDEGKVRWYLDLSFAAEMVSPFQRLRDGTLLMVTRNTIYEFDMLGKPL